jgi:Zn-dependent protease
MEILSYIREGDFVAAFAYLLSAFAVIFLVLPVHEYAHGWAASKLGDPTAKYSGRLSLNPMHHIDWMGAAMILLFGFGWAKPVPVNTRYFKNPKRDMALTALAGPLSNLFMAFVALLFGNVFLRMVLAAGGALLSSPVGMVFLFLREFFTFFAIINVGLAVFNLIPVPPLDGSRLLTALLPNHLYYKVMEYERILSMALFVLVFTGALDVPLTFLRVNVFNVLKFVAGLPFGL